MRITIENFEFDAVIGILENERSAPQRVVVDLVVEYHHTNSYFLDYVALRDLVKDEIINGKFGLIEEALDLITSRIMDQYSAIEFVDLTIKKPTILGDCVIGVGKRLSRD